MKLSGDQIRTLADFSDGDDCFIARPKKGLMGGEIITAVIVTRIDDPVERVRIFETGQIERVPDGAQDAEGY
jgi:hypothetical protein